MASFDIVSKTDLQLLDNALNVAKKEILNRFDFNGSKSSIELDKKTLSITILTENEMRLEALVDTLSNRMIKQKLNPSCLDDGKESAASGNMIRKEITVKQGIDKDTARKIIKEIKDAKLKVTAQAMDDQIRVTGKQINDLQATIRRISEIQFDLPLQFVNFK